LSEKLVPTIADRGCRQGSSTDSYGRILGFLERSSYYFFRVAAQLYSRDSGPSSSQLLLRKCGRAANRTRTSGSIAPLSAKVGTNFSDKRLSLADSGHGVRSFFLVLCLGELCKEGGWSASFKPRGHSFIDSYTSPKLRTSL
jgi:hypothetical protein